MTGYNIWREVCRLRQTPRNRQEAYNKLLTLDELDRQSNPHHARAEFCGYRPSKRRRGSLACIGFTAKGRRCPHEKDLHHAGRRQL